MRHLKISITFFSIVLSCFKGVGCSKHTTQYGCDHFSQCVWKEEEKVCVLNPKGRGFNSDADNRLSSTSFAANLSLYVPKSSEIE